MNKDMQRKIVHDALIVLGVVLLLTWITRLWPIILLVILAIIAGALRLIFLRVKTPKIIVPTPPLPALSQPETEASVIQKAFGLLQRRITEALVEKYPDGRWVWGIQNAIEKFENNDPLIIFLKSAGGYKQATVKTHNLLFLSLEYESAAPIQSSSEEQPEEPHISTFIEEYDIPEEATTDYSLMAFEWVSSNLISINGRCNEAIARNEKILFIPSEELPHPESWFDICKELERNEFEGVLMIEGGIELKLPR